MDLSTGMVTVRQQAQYFAGVGMKFSTPKAAASERRLKVDRRTLSLFNAWRSEQVILRLRAPAWIDNDLVSATDRGKSTDQSNDRRQFKRLLRRTSTSQYRVHDARQTAITNMVMDGTPIPTIQSVVGHSDVRTTMRVPAVLDERARGVNPLALIFPNPSGGLFGEQNLRNRVWAPAAEELGWAMDEYVTSLGRRRRLFRFTLHALRDRFANTAIHEWKYPEDVLLQQGAWEDSETVRRFYAGVTDESQAIAMRIHGWRTRDDAAASGD